MRRTLRYVASGEAPAGGLPLGRGNAETVDMINIVNKLKISLADAKEKAALSITAWCPFSKTINWRVAIHNLLCKLRLFYHNSQLLY